MRRFLVAAFVAAAVFAPMGSAVSFQVRTINGSGNNQSHSDWGQAGALYLRVAPANFADGFNAMVGGPSPRYISNRIHNDNGQNIFSENDISQWGWAWGQFIDHDIGLRDEREFAGDHAPMPFSAKDNGFETFRNDFGVLDFFRTPAAPGTGVRTSRGAVVRQETNSLTSFIDASQVYGSDNTRLDALRGGRDGNPANSSPFLVLPDGYLPRQADLRTTVAMDRMGPLAAPGGDQVMVLAGDVRANENIALTGIQTLFAREHNRIVASLPRSLSDEDKFQIARRVVGAEIEFITYNEFLPTLGIRLDSYRGYNPNVNPNLENEFAAMGFRAHSMIHGEFEPTVSKTFYTTAQLNSFRARGVVVEDNGDGTITLVIPLTVAFGNPGLLKDVGIAQVLQSLGEHQYKNDEQIDNALRSVLFQVPKPGIPDPSVCGTPAPNPNCFTGVADLGADDINRGRDHGMPYYNDMRKAFGLAPVTSFTQITGESTSSFPFGLGIENPAILDFVQLRDINGNVIALPNNEDAVVGVRRTTLAARLRAIYGDVNKVDAFVGMVSEAHVRGTEFGPLQLAIWKRQFQDLRDGDRFFYGNDSALNDIQQRYGISYRKTLAQVIAANTRFNAQGNLFRAV